VAATIGGVPEGLSATEVGKEIAEHAEHAKHDEHVAPEHARRDRLISIAEAVLLSIVTLMAAWSGYSAAKWGSDSSLSLARSSSAQNEANLDSLQASQIRTLDSVSFNGLFAAYTTHDPKLFKIMLHRMRPGYLVAVNAWLATHPLKNPHAPPDPSYMPQYKIPQQTEARALDAQSQRDFIEAQGGSGTADKYVRLTVFLAAVLFLVGIASHFPVRSARYGLIGIASLLLIVSAVQLLGLPGPPS
jgi:hypothetical protein